ncbi:MAG: pesticidal protein Cry7Aa [Candidatus Aenigmatarchaeota archaeon]|nr:MAG: pesticidal protein Cry7Aa [Candidatus Aenigmarchaeota archaeon]
MIKTKKHGVIMEPTDREFESRGVLNPGCYQDGDDIHMFYRAVRWGNRSSIGYAKLDGPMDVSYRMNKPFMTPQYKYERYGLEDPRIVNIEGTFYMTYVAYDGRDALTAYATGKHITRLRKRGLLTPTMSYTEAEKWMRYSRLKDKYHWFASYYRDILYEGVKLRDKDVILFPRKIGGKFVMFHRIVPDMQLVSFHSFSDLNNDFWIKHLKNLSRSVVIEPRFWYETRNVGGGCPPVETKKGWLVIYHGVQDSNEGKTYHAGAVLLSKHSPRKVIGHLKNPLFSPSEDWELEGTVDDVVFPTGTAIFGKRLYIYYGAADKRIAVASVNMSSLVDELLENGPRDGNFGSD